ncbi:hypothetical protein HAX54_053093 [Datura stramonium]|uniref:Uncharacterized protein n=1 Tax=Datura stramonium TaxID=4076 RepID=A0ABS8WT66_DATST|nr:hypothetical protein [Datura stramonium]
MIGKVNQETKPSSSSETNVMVQCLPEKLARKDVEIAKMHVDHQDSILLIHEKYVLAQEILRAKIYTLQSNLDRENKTNSKNLQGLYNRLKQSPPSSSTPPS